MTLEQLQGMSDQELNKLAAIDLLWGGFVNTPSDSWNPTADMNQAMQLANIVFEFKYLRLRLEKGPDDGYFAAFVTTPQSHIYYMAKHNTASRAITIAAILAFKTTVESIDEGSKRINEEFRQGKYSWALGHDGGSER